MTIQPYNSSPSFSYDELPDETLVKCFSYVDLDDRPTLEMICTTWRRVSSDDACWKSIAFERKINPDLEAPSLRDKVFLSFGPYCRAARIIFPRELIAIPTKPNPAQERMLINNTLKGLDLMKIDSVELIRDNPTIFFTQVTNQETPSDSPIEDLVKTFVELKVPLNQVLMSLKIFTADDLFSNEASSILHILDMPKLLFASMVETHFKPQKEIFEAFEKMQIHFTTSQYLAAYTDKPSGSAILPFCSAYAIIEYMKALDKLNTIRYEKNDIITPLLNGLSGDAWTLAFETFMKNQGVSLDLKIHYPIFIQDLVKKMDEKEFQAIIDPVNLLTPAFDMSTRHYYDVSQSFRPTGDKFHDYMVIRMQESYKQSFFSIRKINVPKS